MDAADEFGAHNFDAHDVERSRTCRECGQSLESFRKGTIYCSSACRQRYTRHEKRKESDISSYLIENPEVSLEDLYRQVDPSTWHKPRELVDEYEDQGPGHISNHWDDMQRVQDAIHAVEMRYERRLEPYQEQLRRNPGVRPAGMVALERACDQEIDDLIAAYERADELGRAARSEPARLMQAHERKSEQAALQAFGNDRPGRRHTRTPEYHGRATRDLFRWQ